LLLLCAPEDILDGFELSNETSEEYANHLDELKNGMHGDNGIYCFVETFVLALYYANKNMSCYMKTEKAKVTASLYISPFVLFKLVELATIEEFPNVYGLRGEIEKGKLAERNRKSVNVKHAKNRVDKENRKQKIQEMWASGKYSTRDICAEEEYSGLGYKSLRSARKDLENTPKSNRKLPSTS
jgi:hypothetical protein